MSRNHVAQPCRASLSDAMSSRAEVESLLRQALQPSSLEVTDVSGDCGSAFDVRVVSEAFVGRSRLEKHRMVHEALGDVMGKIHALKIDAKEP